MGEFPEWLTSECVVADVDTDALLPCGQHPSGLVRTRAATLAPGQCVRLVSSFRPVPLMDRLSRQGYQVYSVERELGQHDTYVSVSSACSGQGGFGMMPELAGADEIVWFVRGYALKPVAAIPE